MPELKPLPCPHCLGTNTRPIFDEDGEYFVLCRACGMRGSAARYMFPAIRAWNSLPRTLAWTTEPPKETGFYWWKCDGHIKTGPQVAHVKTGKFRHNGSGLEMLFIHHGPTYHHCDKCQWAGPIPMPLEPEE